MSNNSFKPEKFFDHTIVDPDGKVVGHLRVKPSGVLWAPKSARAWHGVTIAKFAEWIIEHGRSQNK